MEDAVSRASLRGSAPGRCQRERLGAALQPTALLGLQPGDDTGSIDDAPARLRDAPGTPAAHTSQVRGPSFDDEPRTRDPWHRLHEHGPPVHPELAHLLGHRDRPVRSRGRQGPQAPDLLRQDDRAEEKQVSLSQNLSFGVC